MTIKMKGRPYRGGDVVMVTYGSEVNDKYGAVDVGRFLLEEEAQTLNSGKDPWSADLSKVVRPKGKVHYYPDCGGRDFKGIARSIQATTCLHCLLRRARQLRGWRWTHPDNRNEVEHLKDQLGARVDDFNLEGAA
jgi:hypothetical protein